jgi:hypothetical protein
MKLSGAAIIRNGVKLEFPFVESIKSILPLCDEFVIGVGAGEDDTRKAVENINDRKIRILDTVWDFSKRAGGELLSSETNKVIDECKGDWIFYLQSDEVVNEKDFDKIRAALERAEKDPAIEGIVFDYLHFYGSYFTVQKGRNWYRREVRIIRNRPGIRSFGDAQGFKVSGEKPKAIASGARIYHYGWARPPAKMMEKIRSFHKLWHDDEWIEKACSSEDIANYFTDLGNLEDFAGGHPAVMAKRIDKVHLALILELRENYLKKRGAAACLKDHLRRLSLGERRNFRLKG